MNYGRGRDRDNSGLDETVVRVNRVAKVVKGGKRFSFSALVVVGDRKGRVGFAIGKAGEVPEAIRKGVEQARKALITVPMVDKTIPHEVTMQVGAGRVFIEVRVERPVEPGAGPALRIVVDDDGRGLSAAERTKASRRGLRLDESKPGSGLGLSIVVDLAALYGGSLSLGNAPIGGLRAELVLPGV